VCECCVYVCTCACVCVCVRARVYVHLCVWGGGLIGCERTRVCVSFIAINNKTDALHYSQLL